MSRAVVSGARVVRTLVAIVLATVVVPPAAAWGLNARRVALTGARALAAVTHVNTGDGRAVVCGPGRLPDLDVQGAGAIHVAWVTAAVVSPDAFGRTLLTDAWGRCFLVSDRWILSAGPNGVIETPRDAATLGGDDIGARR